MLYLKVARKVCSALNMARSNDASLSPGSLPQPSVSTCRLSHGNDVCLFWYFLSAHVFSTSPSSSWETKTFQQYGQKGYEGSAVLLGDPPFGGRGIHPLCQSALGLWTICLQFSWDVRVCHHLHQAGIPRSTGDGCALTCHDDRLVVSHCRRYVNCKEWKHTHTHTHTHTLSPSHDLAYVYNILKPAGLLTCIYYNNINSPCQFWNKLVIALIHIVTQIFNRFSSFC